MSDNKEKIDDMKKKLESVKESIEDVRRSAENATPELKKKVDDLFPLLKPVNDAANMVIPEDKTWDPIRGFVRRILSREVIIAVVTIIVIATGNLGAEEAIGVAVAGTGLVIGRSAVKARQKISVN